MSFVALEMPVDAAADFQRNGLIGAGGPLPNKRHVFTCLLSDQQWSVIEKRLLSQKTPFKVRMQGSEVFTALNSPAW